MLKAPTYPNVEVGTAVVNSEVLDPGGKALVEPEVSPPFHRHQVAEPHVGQLVCHCQSDVPFRLQGRLHFVY